MNFKNFQKLSHCNVFIWFKFLTISTYTAISNHSLDIRLCPMVFYICTKREEPIVKAARRPLQTGPSKGSADSTSGAPTGMP